VKVWLDSSLDLKQARRQDVISTMIALL
jgi:hypothetical protein